MKSYQDRLWEYETEKRKLQDAGLTQKQYQAEIKKLIERLKI